MSGIEQELLSEEVDVKENVPLPRTLSDFEKEILTQQAFFKEEITQRDQVIVEHETEKDKLNSKLDDGLLLIRNELEEKFNNLRKLLESLGHDVAELPNMRKELADGFVSMGKLMKQQAQQPSGSNYVANRDVSCYAVIETQLEALGNKMNETATDNDTEIVTIRSTIAADEEAVMKYLRQANGKTISRYEQMLTDRGQIVKSIKMELTAFNDIITKKDETLNQLNEQIANQKSCISELKALVENKDSELLAIRKSVHTKDEEISDLKNLLKLADRKLEERLEQMKQMETMASSVQQLTQLIIDGKVNRTGKMEVVHTAVEAVQSKLSSFTELMDHIKHVGTWKINDASVERETELPDYLKRLKQLYKPLTEKLSAVPVAAELFQNDELSLTELQKVQFAQTPVEAAEYLLNGLLQIRNEVHFDCFLNALKTTNQQHIFLWLTFDEYDIDSQHSDLIRENYTYLVRNLSTTESGLIAELFQRGVVDDREKQFLEVGEGAVCQAERLLSVLSRKPVEKFQQFLIALDQTEQSHIAVKLRSYQQLVGSSVADTVVPEEGLSSMTVADNGEAHEAATGNTMSLFKDGCSARLTSTSTVTHVITASEDRKDDVNGLTVHGDELFIVRRQPKSGRIEVYNATNFTFKRYIKVKHLARVNGLTSCDSNNCLYVSYWRYIGVDDGCIARVELTGDNKVVEWKLKDRLPEGLSVNSEHNLMVACRGPSPQKLIECTTRGELVREILLQDDVHYPWHAIQLNNYQFLVCHGSGDSLHRVCVVDAYGRVLLSYGNERGSETGQLNEPQQLVVDRNGYIFVANRGNNRIVVLDSSLKWSRDLQFDGGSDVKKPCALYLDEQRNLLFVGESNNKDSRVVAVTV